MRQVESRDNVIDKKLNKFKSDKSIIDGYFRALEDLKNIPDPTTIGERENTENTDFVLRYISQKITV